MAKEVWKTIPVAPNYEISSRKRVRNKRTGHILTPSSTNHVYLPVHSRRTRNVNEIYDITFLEGMDD